MESKQNNIRKENKNKRTHTFWIQKLLPSYSNPKWLLAKEWKYKWNKTESLEINVQKYVQYFWQWHQQYTMEKEYSLQQINGTETSGLLHAKQ